MKNSFQLIIIVVFVALAIFGLLVFSGAIPLGGKGGAGSLGTVVLWGTVKATTMAPLLEEFNTANSSFVLKYIQKSVDTFDNDLLEALASGTGPDMIFLPDDLAFHYVNKISVIPYSSLSLSSFKNTYASAGEVFLTSKGILALPFSIDPLVMYYNRSILDANSIIYPPAFWDEMSTLIPTITKKDASNQIIKSTVALGHFSNVINAKDILATLFMQTGNGIVSEQDGIFSSSLLAFNANYDLASVLKFYTDFADPNKDVYSWNKSFPNSNDAFSREDLAFYFGFASELASLVNKNPNQNFSVASIPQIKNAKFKLTGAHVTGIALLASSKNLNTALIAANLLTSGDFSSKYALATGVAPARRNLLAIKPTDAYSTTFYNSALYAKSWIDPSPVDTDDIFRSMIEGVLSNNTSIQNALTNADSHLSILLRN